MFAIKTGNAVDFAGPHPKAEKLAQFMTNEFMKIVKANGGPDNLVQVVQNGSIETTIELMKAVDVVVATGGGAMVKSAVLVGLKPSFGVGAGNVPVIVRSRCESEATPSIRSSWARHLIMASSARTSSSCWFTKISMTKR